MSWSKFAGYFRKCAMATAAALSLLLVFGGDVWAESPTETLQGVFVAVNRVVDNPGLQDKPQELFGAMHHVMNESFDFREAARLAMGREWEARTSIEQDEFVRLFAALLQRAYMSQMTSSRASMQGGLAIRYTGESIEGDRASVVTVMGSRGGKEMPLEYRMIRDGERWAIYDVVFGGVSLVGSYRMQFSKVIRQSSYADLVVRLKAQVN